MRSEASAAVRRLYSRNEQRLDLVVHVAGVLFAVNGTLWLLWHVTGLPVIVSVSVYCVGLLAMTTASAVYNLWPPHRPSKTVLRRLDHSAIFIMIAATYTPFAANRVAGPAGGAILAAIWLCATIGIALKVLFPGKFEKTSVAFYVAMGWMIVAAIEPLAASVAAVDFWLLILGGCVYSAGIVFYLLERIPFHKAIWHCFVLAAAILHFSAVALEFTA